MAITKGKQIMSMDDIGISIANENNLVGSYESAKVSSVIKQTGIISNTNVVINNPVFYSNEYSKRSSYLLRSLKVLLSNDKGDTFVLNRCKISVSGSKYIGIQQDMFTIKLYNLNLGALAAAINNKYTI